MVEWEPLVGVLPPLTEHQWEEAFALYQQYPEYIQLRPEMTLAEYKVIYYWKYSHRMLARTIGIVFLLPLLFFWLRGYLNGPLTRRLLILFGLGALQGLMGWLMVASGLVDRPPVAHERLAAHLLIAFAIFAYCLWTAADLQPKGTRRAIDIGAEDEIDPAALGFTTSALASPCFTSTTPCVRHDPPFSAMDSIDDSTQPL